MAEPRDAGVRMNQHSDFTPRRTGDAAWPVILDILMPHLLFPSVKRD